MDEKTQTPYPKKRKRRLRAVILAFLALLLFAACYAVSDAVRGGLHSADSSLWSAPFDLEAFLRSPPAFTGNAAAELNGNSPLFTGEELETLRGITYSELDALGRCGRATAYLGPETLPTGERSPIGTIRPSGWHTTRYDGLIEDKYLYNRCHLIGYQLAGENAEARNLITGTRFLNIVGMLPYEKRVYDYITATGGHVLYRVTPVFAGGDLLASGVLMEASSVEDKGAGLCFFVYAYNAQPGIVIDYASGDSHAEEMRAGAQAAVPFVSVERAEAADSARALVPDSAPDAEITYVLNTHTRRFHTPDCPSVAEMKEKNRQSFTGTREEAEAAGYLPCGRCKP